MIYDWSLQIAADLMVGSFFVRIYVWSGLEPGSL